MEYPSYPVEYASYPVEYASYPVEYPYYPLQVPTPTVSQPGYLGVGTQGCAVRTSAPLG